MAKRLKTELIVIHCSATDDSIDIGVNEIREWHTLPYPKGRGWADIGYHRVIRRNGVIEEGRKLDDLGAHAKGHNHKSIGICLVGGVEADDKNRARDNFTPEQKKSLKELLEKLILIYPGVKIVGHCDLDSAKACPSFSVSDFIKEVGLQGE